MILINNGVSHFEVSKLPYNNMDQLILNQNIFWQMVEPLYGYYFVYLFGVSAHSGAFLSRMNCYAGELYWQPWCRLSFTSTQSCQCKIFSNIGIRIELMWFWTKRNIWREVIDKIHVYSWFGITKLLNIGNIYQDKFINYSQICQFQ